MTAKTRRTVRCLASAIAVQLAGGLLVGCSSSSTPPPAMSAEASSVASPSAAAAIAANQFLRRYVDADGRVVRRDQGGDTVSEGQGYALLLAVATGDRGRFSAVWRWTRQHLQLPSGLFAWRWDAGKLSATPATDADIQIGWALALAGEKWGESGWTKAARRISSAVAQNEIGYDDNGNPMLTAGPWAVHQGAPNIVEPGYWTPPAESTLARLTGDHRLEKLATTDLSHLHALTNDGGTLPPDWAELGGGANGQPVGAPDGSAPVQSGPDGQRALVWTTCTAAGRQLAAKWWPLISSTADAAPLTRNLDGSPLQQDAAPLSAVAAAAAAKAAGNGAAVQRLLDRASQINAQYPTYYGAAWVALGRILLSTTRLAHC